MENVRQTYGSGVAIGVLKEKKIEFETVELKKSKGTCKKAIGSVVLGIKNEDYEFRFRVNEKYDNEKASDNFSYEQVCRVSDLNVGDMVVVDFDFTGFNDYAKNGKVYSIDQKDIKKIHTTDESDEQLIEGKLEGLVYSIVPEIVNEEETDRKIVTFVGVDYKGEAAPHKLYVDEDVADEFEELYAVGESGKIDIEIVNKRYGGTKTRTGGFGRKAKVNDGFTREEWCIIGADEPFDKDAVKVTKKQGEVHLKLNHDDIKNLMKERENKLIGLKQNGGSKSNKGDSLKDHKLAEPTDETCPF